MIRVPNKLIRYAIILNYTIRDAVHQVIKTLEDIEERQADERSSSMSSSPKQKARKRTR